MILVQACRMDPALSCIAQTITCMQLSFLLNRWFTWRDHATPLWVACYRFSVQRAVATAVDFALYADLVKLGLNYFPVNLMLTTLFTLINYALERIWTFAISRPKPR